MRTTFWAQMALASLVAMKGPKQSRISGLLPLPMVLVMDGASIKIIHYVPRYVNNRYYTLLLVVILVVSKTKLTS